MTYKVYIAGKISDHGVDHLNNMHKFFVYQNELIRLGFAPFNPAADYILGLMFGDYTYDMYFEPNAEWLKVADAVLMIPGWEESKGALKEMDIAKRRDIPIFTNIPDLMAWAEKAGV